MTQTALWRYDAEPKDPEEYGLRLLDIAIRRYKPVAVFGMLSGGHDSLCATHMVSRHPAFTGAVHINTGIGVEETRQFVRRVSQEMRWELWEYRAVDQGEDYDELVLEYGFPGPFHHRKMYSRLKERALDQVLRDFKTKRSDRIMLVTGVRRYESTRRMGTVQSINRRGAKLWVAPLTWFQSRHKHAYMEKHSLPRNEVVDQLHMSGECLCGAFAKPGELEWLEFCGFSDVVERIRKLESQVEERGISRCRWGTGREHQVSSEAPGFLCVGCENRTHQNGG